MRLLLDTHVWLWLISQPERIPPQILRAIVERSNIRLLSAASCWEISIKYALGRLALPVPARDYIPGRLALSSTRVLRMNLEHALQVADLPPHHRGPFDRMLVAQAPAEGLILVTNDRRSPHTTFSIFSSDPTVAQTKE